MMIIFILFLAFILRIASLNQSFWLDEAAQVIESNRSFLEQFDIRADFWPPLYHLLLHFWMVFGRTEIWIRLLSVILGVITIWCTFLLGKEMTKSHKIALTGAFLLAISPFHIWYSQEVRPYALAALLGTLTVYFLIRKQGFWYAVSTILFIYTTYLAPFLLLGEGIYVVFSRKWVKSWIICIFITFFCFIPWVPSFLQQLTIGRGLTSTLPGWSDAVSTPLIKSIPLIFTKFILGRVTFDNKIIYSCLVAVLFLISGWWVIQGLWKRSGEVAKLLLLGGVPLGVAFFTSLFLPILAPQRVLFVLPLFYLLLALGLTETKRPYNYTGIILVVVSFYSWYLYQTVPRFQREKWREAVRFVESSRNPHGLAVFVFPDAFAPWKWYSHNLVSSIGVAPTFTVKKNEIETFVSQFITADTIYYFHYLTGLTDPKNQTESMLKNVGFIATQMKDFPGVGFITIYEKSVAFR